MNQHTQEKDQRGFFDPQTMTFYKVKNQQIYQKVLKFMEQQAKLREDQQYKKRLQEEKFDDFEYVVQEVQKKQWRPEDLELKKYDF